MVPTRTFLGLLPLWLLLVSTCSYVTMDEGMGIITEEAYPVHGDHGILESTTCPIPKCIGTVVACIPLCFSPSKSVPPILPSSLSLSFNCFVLTHSPRLGVSLQTTRAAAAWCAWTRRWTAVGATGARTAASSRCATTPRAPPLLALAPWTGSPSTRAHRT